MATAEAGKHPVSCCPQSTNENGPRWQTQYALRAMSLLAEMELAPEARPSSAPEDKPLPLCWIEYGATAFLASRQPVGETRVRRALPKHQLLTGARQA